MINQLFRISFTLLFLNAVSFSQDKTGKLLGSITEMETESGLPGVNIILKGTYYGSASDVSGNYMIENIRPGDYDVEISMIGYKVLLQTGIRIEG